MRYSILFTILCLVLLPSFLPAEVPLYINYQGRLTDSLGIPVPDGDYTVLFGIWNSELEGEMLWGNDFEVAVEDGLFSIELGPLPDDIFESNTNRWLSIEIPNRMGEMSPRTKINSGAYAFHALRADTAGFVPGIIDCGWIRDTRGVRLSVPGDSVCIGPAAPSAKLEVEGDIKTSNSLTASYLNVGSMSQSGNITVFKDGLTFPIAKLREYEWTGGGGLYLYQNSPHGSVVHIEPDVDGAGAYLSLFRDSYNVGFYVNGNKAGSGEPQVGVLGSDRAAIFDMTAAGDSSVMLPYSCISSSEMYNEAGIANSELSSAVTLSFTPTEILEREMYFPTSGYVCVIASASFYFWHIHDTATQFTFGISETAGVIPSEDDYYRSLPASLSTFQYSDMITIHEYYQVSAGHHTYYFNGAFIGSDTPHPGIVGDANLTVMFFPTWRGYIFIPPGSDESAATNPEQYERDRLIMQKIEEEKQALRQEFDAKLEEIKVEIQKQMGE